ncbi:MAG: hypothetical protein GC131_09140 [Alphaproteobacteria bacterium]|nr:hypothetical protein [Alphaproteobacteria bacterium]
MFGKRILMLAPHPDDEVVACAAAIARARAAGAEVFIYFLTTGVIAREILWPWQRHRHDFFVRARRLEAEKAALALGAKIVGGAARPTRSLRFYLHDMVNEVKWHAAKYDIDQLWVLAYEGGHPDHDAASGAASVLNKDIPVLEFAAYNYCGGRACAQTFPQAGVNDTVIALTPEEQSRKRKLLRLYASEQKNLGYVGVERESFRPLPAHDYGKPPHTGTLWYARFHWVPLRHPRIDRTTSTNVSQAIAAFRHTVF